MDRQGQTDPAMGWTGIFHIYGPFKPFFDNTWKLRVIEEVKEPQGHLQIDGEQNAEPEPEHCRVRASLGNVNVRPG